MHDSRPTPCNCMNEPADDLFIPGWAIRPPLPAPSLCICTRKGHRLPILGPTAAALPAPSSDGLAGQVHSVPAAHHGEEAVKAVPVAGFRLALELPVHPDWHARRAVAHLPPHTSLRQMALSSQGQSRTGSVETQGLGSGTKPRDSSRLRSAHASRRVGPAHQRCIAVGQLLVGHLLLGPQCVVAA